MPILKELLANFWIRYKRVGITCEKRLRWPVHNNPAAQNVGTPKGYQREDSPPFQEGNV